MAPLALTVRSRRPHDPLLPRPSTLRPRYSAKAGLHNYGEAHNDYTSRHKASGGISGKAEAGIGLADDVTDLESGVYPRVEDHYRDGCSVLD